MSAIGIQFFGLAAVLWWLVISFNFYQGTSHPVTAVRARNIAEPDCVANDSGRQRPRGAHAREIFCGCW